MSQTYPEPDELMKLKFHLMGDVNDDGVIDEKDRVLLQTAYGKMDANADLNGDGKVTLSDLVIFARNAGKGIYTEWHKILDQQAYDEKQAAETGTAYVPWYIAWARELGSYQAKNTEAYANFVDPRLQSQVESLLALTALPDSIWKGHIENYEEMLNAQIKATRALFLTVGQMPLSETQSQDYQDTFGLSKELADKIYKDAGIVQGLLPTERIAEGKQAVKTLQDMQTAIVNAETVMIGTNAGLKTAIGSDLGVVNDAWSLASKAYGLDSVIGLATIMPIQAAVIMPAKQFWNALYTPELPGIGDLVRMFANGKITDVDFAETMALNGFDEFWQAKYWEAHWTKPSVTDALTAWRRGKLTDAELDALFTNCDLDPAWKNIWEDRKFNDLSIGAAHTLYDIGLIDDAKVFDISKRQGYFPDDAALMAESIKQFPIRRIKLRGLLALANAAATGSLTRLQILVHVTKLGYDVKLVDWLVWYGELRQSITTSKVAKAPTEKLLGLGDLKAAYTRGLLSEDAFRTELLLRNYNLDEIQILLALMSDRRTVEEAGGKFYALSVVELLNAWRYEVITEDDLRNKLLARGLPLDELDTLIKTKKIQWKLTPLSPVNYNLPSQATPT